MKRKIAALLLSAALCVTAVSPAGAAELMDQTAGPEEISVFSEASDAEETLPAATVQDIVEDPDVVTAQEAELFLDDLAGEASDPQEEQGEDEDSSKEEISGTDSVIESAEAGNPGDGTDVTSGDAELDIFDAGQDGSSGNAELSQGADDVFQAWEDGGSEELPQVPEAGAEDEELLSRPEMEEGSVLMGEWKRTEDGKWMLLKYTGLQGASAEDGQSTDGGAEEDGADLQGDAVIFPDGSEVSVQSMETQMFSADPAEAFVSGGDAGVSDTDGDLLPAENGMLSSEGTVPFEESGISGEDDTASPAEERISEPDESEETAEPGAEMSAGSDESDERALSGGNMISALDEGAVSGEDTDSVSAENEMPAAGEEDSSAENAEPAGTETEAPAEGESASAQEGGQDSAQEEVSGGDLMQESVSDTYYTLKDGIVHIRTMQLVGGSLELLTEGDYLFDENGYMVTGRKTVPAGTPGSKYTKDKEHFFMDGIRAKLVKGGSGEFTPYNSNLGQMQKAYWLWTGTAFRYYSSNAGYLSMSTLKDVNEKAGKYKGYYKINGVNYCLKSNGVPREGFYKITDVKDPGSYYFLTKAESGDNIPGAMLCNGWRTRTVNGKTQWRYYMANGRHRDTGVIATKLDTSKMGNSLYLLNAEGTLLTNTMAQATKNKYWYFSDSKGKVYTSRLVTYKGARYCVNESGKRITEKNAWRKIKCASNRYYYFGSTPGKIVEKKGWQKVVTPKGTFVGWFYFPATGNHLKNKLTGTGRYFDSTGKMVSGLKTVNGKTYFFQSSTSKEPKGVMYKKTWIVSKNKRYYARSNGVLYKSTWASIGGSWYYFQKDCSVKVNATAVKDGVKGYLDSKGKFCTGWVVVSNGSNLVKYVNPATGKFAANTSLVIDGLTYWFDKNGYRLNDVTDRVGGPYYVEVDRVNGVLTVFNSARTIPVKSIRVSVGLPGTSTPTGRYTLTPYGRWQSLMGPSWGQYATHVNGAGYGGIFIHSVASTYANSYNLPAGEYNKLGSPASHGCIRCCVADAKWVYEHCSGARIYIFDGTYKADEVFKGPLGRRPLTPLRGSMNFDPTDPAVA